jgi:hypothetical protein
MSVKVAVRVRPFNERESGSKCCIRMVSKFNSKPLYRTGHKLLCLTQVQDRRGHSHLTIHFGPMTDSEMMLKESQLKFQINMLIKITYTMH